MTRCQTSWNSSSARGRSCTWPTRKRNNGSRWRAYSASNADASPAAQACIRVSSPGASTAWSMGSTLPWPPREASGGAAGGQGRAGQGRTRVAVDGMETGTHGSAGWGRAPRTQALCWRLQQGHAEQMIQPSRLEGAAPAAGMVVPAEAARLHAALRGLLPGAGWVAVGWRQDGVPGCAEAGDGGPAALGLLQRVLAGESVVAPGVE